MNASIDIAKQSAAFQALMTQLGAIIEDAADDDHAGTWGMDGWIRTIHNLIDLQIRTYATWLQIGIGGPSGSVPGGSDEADDTGEFFEAPTATDYARRYAIVVPFKRVGKSDVVIPTDKLKFDPAILPAGERRFMLTVEDDKYIGSNYLGSVGFCAANAATEAPPEGPSLAINVGL